MLDVILENREKNLEQISIQSVPCLKDLADAKYGFNAEQTRFIDKMYDTNNTRFKKLNNDCQQRFNDTGWDLYYNSEANLAYTFIFKNRNKIPTVTETQSMMQMLGHKRHQHQPN